MDTLTFNTLAIAGSIATLLAACLVLRLPLWGYPAADVGGLRRLGLVSQLAAYFALVYALGHLPATLTSVGLLAQVPCAAVLAGCSSASRSAPRSIGGGDRAGGIFVVTWREAPAYSRDWSAAGRPRCTVAATASSQTGAVAGHAALMSQAGRRHQGRHQQLGTERKRPTMRDEDARHDHRARVRNFSARGRRRRDPRPVRAPAEPPTRRGRDGRAGRPRSRRIRRRSHSRGGGRRDRDTPRPRADRRGWRRDRPAGISRASETRAAGAGRRSCAIQHRFVVAPQAEEHLARFAQRPQAGRLELEEALGAAAALRRALAQPRGRAAPSARAASARHRPSRARRRGRCAPRLRPGSGMP